MARNSNFQYLKRLFNEGINTMEDDASLNELEDATNVWAPDGALTSRPGFVGLPPIMYIGVTGGASVGSNPSMWKETGIVVGTPVITPAIASPFNVDDMVVGDHLYLRSLPGSPAYWDDPTTGYAIIRTGFGGCGLVLRSFYNTANTNTDAYFILEYFNTETWVPLPFTQAEDATETYSPVAFAWDDTQDPKFMFAFPPDMDFSVVPEIPDSSAALWFRLTLQGGAPSAGTDVGHQPVWGFLGYQTDVIDRAYGGFFYDYELAMRFVSGTQWFAEARQYVTGTPATSRRYRGQVPDGNPYLYATTSYEDIDETLAYATAVYLPSYTTVPEYAEGFITYRNEVLQVYADTAKQSPNIQKVVVEQDPNRFGTRYDPALIAQLDAWPETDYILYFKNRLWSAKGQTIRWGAPAPWFKVWPQQSFEFLIENDDSRITGLAGFGENAVVFKRDSIWIMADDGVDDNGIQKYAPLKVVAGTGAISHHTIQEVRDHLVFLAEDGVYSLSKSWKLEKISDKIDGLIKQLNYGNLVSATAVNWKKRRHYLLAVPQIGSEVNNWVLVFDYMRGRWWKWDAVDVKNWVLIEDELDRDELYFVCSTGNRYILDGGRSLDHGATITSTMKSHHIGDTGKDRRTVRYIEATSYTTSEALGIEVIPDEDTENSVTGTLDFTDSRSLTYRQKRRVTVSTGYRLNCRNFKLVMTHSTKNTKLELVRLKIGMNIKYTRR